MGIIKNIGIRAVSKKHAHFLRREMETSGEDKKEFLLNLLGHQYRDIEEVKEKWHDLFISIVWVFVCDELSYDPTIYIENQKDYRVCFAKVYTLLHNWFPLEMKQISQELRDEWNN